MSSEGTTPPPLWRCAACGKMEARRPECPDEPCQLCGATDWQNAAVATPMRRLAMIFSARDQIAADRRCERALGSLCRSPCECMEEATRRVDAELAKELTNE